jgi:hypothetical protein
MNEVDQARAIEAINVAATNGLEAWDCETLTADRVQTYIQSIRAIESKIDAMPLPQNTRTFLKFCLDSEAQSAAHIDTGPAHSKCETERYFNPTIDLNAGGSFDFLKPEGSSFSIDEIAHSLAHLCRFTGHCGRFYSVAEHSVLASQIVSPEFALEALLHDAAEAFIGDVAAPLKRLLPDYAEMEARVEEVVRNRLNVPIETSLPVKLADLQMLKAEQRQAMCHSQTWEALLTVTPAPVTLRFWKPAQAKSAFLTRYQQLTGKDRI